MSELTTYAIRAATVLPEAVAASAFERLFDRAAHQFLPAVCKPALVFVRAVAQLGICLAEFRFVFGRVGPHIETLIVSF
jgi:hypothetical protein